MAHRSFRDLAAALAAVGSSTLLAAGAATGAAPRDAEFYERQWNLKAIHAHAVFSNQAESRAMAGALVAVVDTGIDYRHPDLAGRVDLEKSTSLITYADPGVRCVGEPGIPYGSDRTRDPIDENARADTLMRHRVTDFHSHGTGVSGLIASNAVALAGLTQGATLFGVKVHGMGRTNCLSAYLDGIRYAADQGADVIHMSIPLEFDTTQFPAAVAAVNDALGYARQRGAILVAAAGNNAANLDAGTRFRFCQPSVVFCVGATGPSSADLLDETTWDEIAAYSNFGTAIDVVGPGGTAAVPVWLDCSTVTEFGGAPQAPCRAGGLVWSSTGTSFGAAATSGLAALLFRLTGTSDPADVEALIERTAVDVAADALDGEGRIDAKQAVRVALR